jgi:hypothetical protein
MPAQKNLKIVFDEIKVNFSLNLLSLIFIFLFVKVYLGGQLLEPLFARLLLWLSVT